MDKEIVIKRITLVRSRHADECVICSGVGEVCACTTGQYNKVKDDYCRERCGAGPVPCPWCWNIQGEAEA